MSKNITTTKVSPVTQLKTVMASASVQEQFKNALKEHSNKFVASLIDLYASDTYLQNCAPNLVVMEALKAATLNLPINKQLGFAYVVPYKKGNDLIPQFQIGYKGLIQLAMRSGVYRYINAGPVLEGEYQGFSKLTGELDISGEAKSDTVVGYFSHIETVNGFKKSMYMTKPDMEKYAKKYSKSYSKNFSPWQTEFDSMAEKTMLRRLLSKYGQMTIEMAEGMAADNPDDQAELDYQTNANSEYIDINTETGEVIDTTTVEDVTPPQEQQQQEPEPQPQRGPGF